MRFIGGLLLGFVMLGLWGCASETTSPVYETKAIWIEVQSYPGMVPNPGPFETFRVSVGGFVTRLINNQRNGTAVLKEADLEQIQNWLAPYHQNYSTYTPDSPSIEIQINTTDGRQISVGCNEREKDAIPHKVRDKLQELFE
jgi:hypothetical protein